MPWDGARDIEAGFAQRLLIVSDVLLYREGVASGLERMGGFAVAGFSEGRDAGAAVETLHPDAVLLDGALPDALVLAAVLHARAPRLPIVGFGFGGGEAVALTCIEAGLVGFVGRDGTIEELAATIRRAVAGEVRCSPRLVALLCERVASLGQARPVETGASLTRREGQVAELIARGLSNKEIALALGIGPATVKNHVHSILDKLKVARRSAIGARLSPTARPGARPPAPERVGAAPALLPANDVRHHPSRRGDLATGPPR